MLVAGNGREALAMLDEAGSVGFGCVLMDVQMPEMADFLIPGHRVCFSSDTRFRLPAPSP